jgi:hypothetical protein
MIVGRKTNNNPGYIWMPYIIMTQSAEVSESNTKNNRSRYVQTVASRYGTFILKIQIRSKKAKKILEKIKDFKS